MESIGTHGGITLFCDSNTNDAPDVLAMARSLGKKEFMACQSHGITDILEIRTGYDALVFAEARTATPLSLNTEYLRKALSRYIPDSLDASKWVLNTARNWHDIDSLLPDRQIDILGPPIFSGAVETLLDIISNTPACRSGSASAQTLKYCRQLREDGIYHEVREHDDSVVDDLIRDKLKIAVIDYPSYRHHEAKLSAIPLNGIQPTAATLANKTYPATRSLYFYVKTAQIEKIPGLDGFLSELTHNNTWGEKGYLTSLGMIPMTAAERLDFALKVKQRQSMSMPSE